MQQVIIWNTHLEEISRETEQYYTDEILKTEVVI